MKFNHLFIPFAVTAVALFTACDDTTSTAGSSLVTDNTEVVIDSAFTLTGTPRKIDSIPARTTTQILGNITAEEYGHFSSDFVAQFMPALQLDTAGTKASDIDSVKLVMMFSRGNLTGDSIVPMGFKVYPLTAQLPSPSYNTSLDNIGSFYDENQCWTAKTQVYTGNALYNDSINDLVYRSVMVDLPKSFAVKFYNEYINHPETFATPQAFTSFFPGIYVKNTFGSGRVINFSATQIRLYYKRHATVTKNGEERDTIYNITSTYMAVTPEVISDNLIRMSLSQSLLNRINNGETLLVAPAGYEVEMTFPTREIISRYRQYGGDLSVINSLTMSIPVEKLANGNNINPPANVLIVLSKDKKSFFADNKITDDKTSFLASYDETTQSYEVTGMRSYIIEMLSKDNITADDYTFTITPVNVVTETSQSGYYSQGQVYVTGINPYVSGPAMCRLRLDKAKIKFTYSKQSL